MMIMLISTVPSSPVWFNVKGLITFCFPLAILLLVNAARLNAQYAGEALYLDSTGSYATVVSTTPFKLSEGTPFTIETWYFVNAASATIVSASDGSQTRWALRVENSISDSWSVLFDSTDVYSVATSNSLSTTAGLVYGMWNHIAVTSDGSTIEFYINGIRSDRFSDTRTIWRSDGFADIYVGTQYSKAAGSLTSRAGTHGRLDNLRFWSRHRSQDEIREDMSGPVEDRTSLVAEYTFDSGTSNMIYGGGAFIEDAELPWIELSPGYTFDDDLSWSTSGGAASSILQVTSDQMYQGDRIGRYMLVGHNGGGLLMVDASNDDLTGRLERVWEIVSARMDYCRFTFTNVSVSDFDPAKVVMLVASDSGFSSNVRLLLKTTDSLAEGFSSNWSFEGGDSVYVTFAELNLPEAPVLRASLGFGPFTQSYENQNTFTVTDLPEGTSRVIFRVINPYASPDEGQLDSLIVEGSSLKSASYTREMGDLPLGALLTLEIQSSSLSVPLQSVQPLIMTEDRPVISSTDGFVGYPLGTVRTNTYQVDSLPPQTSAVTFELVDIAGNPFSFIDTSGSTILLRKRVEGTDLTTASWTLGMDTLELPLSSTLSVTVEHDGGLPGGTTYKVGLGILSKQMVLYTEDSWGPYISNNYERAEDGITPWSDVSVQSASFTVTPLPPRTERVIFDFLNDTGEVLASDTVRSNGVNWLSAAISRSFKLTNLSPLVDTLRATVFVEGGPEEGIIVYHAIDITPQPPRVTLDPSDYYNIPRNPLNLLDTTKTEVLIVVEPSTAETDSVAIQFLDERGDIMDDVSGVPTVISGVRAFRSLYDFASLPYTTTSMRAVVWSSSSANPVSTTKDISLLIPRPRLQTVLPRDLYREGQQFYEHFAFDRILPGVTQVDIELDGDTQSFTKNSPPLAHSLVLNENGSGTYFEIPRFPWVTIDDTLVITVSFWFRTTQEGYAPLFGLQSPSLDKVDYWPWIKLLDDGRLRFGSNEITEPDIDPYAIETPYKVNDGKWHHVMATYDGRGRDGSSEGAMKLFVDGGLIGRQKVKYPWVKYYSTYSYVIGRGVPYIAYGTTLVDYFVGELSELNMWSEELTIEEISEAIYSQDGGAIGVGTQRAYLPLDEGKGSIAVNRKTNRTVEIAGDPEWRTYNGLSHVTATFDMSELAAGNHDLGVMLFYPDGPLEGVTYTWPLVVRPSEDKITLSSDGGFGPFTEGEKVNVNFTTTFDQGSAATVRFSLIDSAGNVIGTNVKTASNQSAAISYDMGEAEPGSSVCVRLFGDGLAATDPLTNPVYFPLVVNPLVPPTFAGHTGPFKQGIAPGAMPIPNTFTINSFLDDLRFEALFLDTAGYELASPSVVKRNDTTWTITYDMAKLAPPMTYLILNTFVGSNPVPQARDTLALTITPTRPVWFNYATYDDVVDNGDDTWTFTLNSPLGGIVAGAGKGSPTNSVGIDSSGAVAIPSEYPMVGDQKMDNPLATIQARLSYNVARDSLWLTETPSVTGALGFASSYYPFEHNVDKATIDDDNNLLINYSTSGYISIPGTVPGSVVPSIGLYGKGFNLLKWLGGTQKLADVAPVAPFVSIQPTLGFGYGMATHLGVQDGKWGGIGDLDITGSAQDGASGRFGQMALGVNLIVGIQMMWGVAQLDATLSLRGIVGVGKTYVTLPKRDSAVLGSFGVQLYATVSAKLFWGLVEVDILGPYMAFHHQWGDAIPEPWPDPKEGWTWSGTERKGDEKNQPAVAGLPPDSTLKKVDVPRLFPQPATAVDNGSMSVVWMEQDRGTGIGTLRFASLDVSRAPFTPPLTITSNANGINTPRVDNLSDSIHIITWLQNRYRRGTAPQDLSLLDAARASDVWYAILNSHTGQVEGMGILDDDFSSMTGGRMEGSAWATALPGEEGLITWIVADPAERTSDIYSAKVARKDGIWSVSSPSRASNLAGVESKLQVIRTPEGKASAVWINQPEDDPYSNRIMTMELEGENWSEPWVLIDSGQGYHFNDLDGAIGGEYGILALTGMEIVDDTGKEFVMAIPWGENGWDFSKKYQYAEEGGYLQRPRAMVNAQGLTGILVQKNNSMVAPNSVVSQVDLLLSDQSTGGGWRHRNADSLLGDTAAMVYDLEGVFVGNLLVLFAHENKTPYGVHRPLFGKYFGDESMNLVIRAVEVNNALEVIDRDEGNLTTSVREKREEVRLSNFGFTTVSPMPFKDGAEIGYYLERGGNVKIEVVDGVGRLVARLVEGTLEPGEYRVTLSGKDIPSGSYHVRFTLDGQTISRGVIKVE
ncbi:MAG: LamG domain-containing protein [Candidatus Kapaibacterium sp.]